MAQFLTPSLMQLYDSSGNPYSGGKLYIYEAGTTTLLSLFSDEALTTPAANPLIADSAGIFPDVFIAETKFKAVFTDSDDVTIKTVDPAYSIGRSDNIMATDVSFDGSSIGFSSTNVQDAIEETTTTLAELTGADFTGALTITSIATGNFLTMTSTNAGSGSSPDIEVYRNSASPAAADALHRYRVYGEDDGGNKTLYVEMLATLSDPTDTSEDGTFTLRTMVAGTLADTVTLAAGLTMAGATGGDQGAGTVNAKGVYSDGVFVGPPSAVLEDQKAAGTEGGTFTSGAWQTRDLNTKVRDPGSLIALSSNEFTPTVDGWVEWSAPAYRVESHQTRLWNVTDSTTDAPGSSETTGGTADTDAVQTRSVGGGPVVAGKAYRIEHQCIRSQGTNGFGEEAAFAIAEVYTRVKFWRTA